MKKIFALLLAGLMIVSLTACGGEKEIQGEITQNGKEESSENSDIEGVVEAEDSSEEEELPDKPLSLGRMEGGTYQNTYIGVACDLDSSWTYYSAEELQELPGNIEELLEGTALMEENGGLDAITDMQAENVEQMLSMNINYSKVSMSERIVFASMSEAEIIDAMMGEGEMLKEAYEQMGITDIQMSAVKVTFLGEEHTALRSYGKIQDVDYYVLQLFDYSLGQYGITYTFSSFVEDNTESMLDLFYVIE